jgi:hypothetical protein
MNQNRSWDNIGDQIQKTVQNALDSGNFKELNEKMTKTVNAALSESKIQVQKSLDLVKATGQSFIKDVGSIPAQARKEMSKVILPENLRKTPQEMSSQDMPQQAQRPAMRPVLQRPIIKVRKVGNVSGLMYMIFGCIGTGVSIALIISVIFYSMWSFPMLLGALIGTILLMTGSITMSANGSAKRKRIKRAFRYLKLCGNRTYINIKDLAQLNERSNRYILKDVKKMIQLGIYPEGHLDEQQTCLMLNQNVYTQYLEVEKERKLREAEALEITGLQQDGKALEEQAINRGENSSEIASLAELGRAYIVKLQDLNMEIKGSIISEKLFQLEIVLKDIFERISTQPNQLPQMQRFMDYYLPTTLKLVQAYRDFDKISVVGEDIISAKTEIEHTLDTINLAFGQLLNNLYRDAAYDVSADAQVLRSMMAREGLSTEMKVDLT